MTFSLNADLNFSIACIDVDRTALIITITNGSYDAGFNFNILSTTQRPVSHELIFYYTVRHTMQTHSYRHASQKLL